MRICNVIGSLPVIRLIALLFASFALTSCATSGGSAGFLDKPMELLGIKKPDTPELPDVSGISLPKFSKSVALKIHAGEQLNTDANGRSLSVVVRIYKLKDTNAFNLSPAEAFKNTEAEKLAFGSDIAEARELVLTPGQKYEHVEVMSPSAPYLGVVAFFRSPAAGRWRFVFDGRQSEKKGVTLGVHDCGMSVAAGEPIGAPPEALRLSGVRCQ